MTCTVPVSAHFTVEAGTITTEEYSMIEVDRSVIADLLAGEFGLDFDPPAPAAETEESKAA